MNIYQAKTRLSWLIDKAASSADVVVGRNGKRLVRITRLDSPERCVTYGRRKGRLSIPRNFDAPLPDDVVATLAGR